MARGLRKTTAFAILTWLQNLPPNNYFVTRSVGVQSSGLLVGDGDLAKGGTLGNTKMFLFRMQWVL